MRILVNMQYHANRMKHGVLLQHADLLQIEIRMARCVSVSHGMVIRQHIHIIIIDSDAN